MADDFWEDFGADLIEAGVAIAVAYGLNEAMSGLSGSNKGGGVSSVYAPKQPRPPIIRFIGGYSRAAPAYVFYETAGNAFHQTFAANDGRLNDVLRVYLSDDHVEYDISGRVTAVLSGANDGRYVDDPGQRVNLQFRMGLPTETAYEETVEVFGGRWTANHRGDGTASVLMRLFSPAAKFKAAIFPQGANINLSIVARGVCFDWRDPAQSRDDESTWGPSWNPVVWLAHEETQRWGLDWDFSVAPVLNDLTVQADLCDDGVPLVGGGTEPRYRFALNYRGDETEDSVRQKILDSMAGYRAIDGLGRLVIRAGAYEAPSQAITADHILGSNWRLGVASENKIDRLNVLFNSPDNHYQKTECDPWIISEEGERSEDFYVEGSPSFSQTRRLAKIKASALSARSAGSFELDDHGLLIWGQRFAWLQDPGSRYMQDIVVELPDGGELGDEGFSFAGREADPAAYSWNPATEEGVDPGSVAPVEWEALADPVIDSAAVFFELSGGFLGPRIEIAASGPLRDDLMWSYRWRLDGASAWTEFSTTSVGAEVVINTGFVPGEADIEVEVTYRTGSGASANWSAAETVSTLSEP